MLQQQPNPEKPATAFTTFLIDSDPEKTCKTRKKQAHEMWGVLFTLLYFMVLSDNCKNLARMMGEKTFWVC